MSIVTREANVNFRNSLRTSDQVKESLNNGNPSLSAFKKLPIEIPTKFRVGINPKNPNYSKSKVIQHRIHNRKNPLISSEQERTYYKRTNSVNSISHIDHMVGVDLSDTHKPVIKLKSKIDEEINLNKDGNIKVNRKKDYRTLFFYKENFYNQSLSKQSSLKDLYSNPFSEEKDLTVYGVDIGKSQLIKRNNSSESIRVKLTRDYYYNSSQFQESCFNVPYDKNFKKDIDNKITSNPIKVNNRKEKFKNNITQVISNENLIPNIKENILSMNNKDDKQSTKKSLYNPVFTFNRNNSSTSIYGIFNNTNKSSSNNVKENKRFINDKIYNNQNVLSNDFFPDKVYNRKACKKLNDGIGIFY